MSARVSPTDRIRSDIDVMFAEGRDMGEVLEDVARLGARLILQTALEAEVTEFLGRERYARGGRARAGSRNGYAPTTVKTTAGPVTLERPKLHGSDEAFASRLLGKGVTRSNALESLVIAGYVRGLSTRDVEASLADALGAEAALSKSTVSRVCSAVADEFDRWRQRSLADVELEYLYLDASHFRFHDGAKAEPVLVAWGITSDGQPRLLALESISAESVDAVVGFLRGLVARGLRPPLLTVTDGAPGLIGAVEQVFAASLRQRCVIHRARNIVAKVSAGDQAQVKADYWRTFDDIDADPGQEAVDQARRRADEFATKWGSKYPGAVACLIDDLDALTVHLRFPRDHWRRIRHTNLIERTFGETRRRVKVIGRLPGERSCLSLIWAVLDRASHKWRGVLQTPANVRLLQQLRTDLHRRPDESSHEPVHDLPDTVTAAA
ncbi:MAG: IS256 family transposase [Euzebyales bacterium]|nr:IS256 family transposase [Euzebyales bacterium]